MESISLMVQLPSRIPVPGGGSEEKEEEEFAAGDFPARRHY
jgi:hypothetical protein